ncbi:MAG: amino acid adenylation domain-containing protein, partial [Oscillospiraceae bacterium]|nr:amino acid adenylation domain-containing protein [Oscillospiraceae bacterium]
SIEFLIADWTSIWNIISEFETIYSGGADKLQPVTVSFRDYVIAMGKIQDTLAYEQDKKYWIQKIETLPNAPQLPLSRNAEQNRYEENVRFERKFLTMPSEKWELFKTRCSQHSITPTAAVMTAYAAVLERWSRNKKFCLNLTVLNRLPLHEQVQQIVGDFTSINILGVDMSQKKSFAEYGSAINNDLFDDLDHRMFSGVEVLRELSRKGDKTAGFMPIVFTSAIGLLNPEATKLQGTFKGVGISQTPQVFIDCQAMDGNFGLQINWDIRKGIFCEGVTDAMFKAFETLLNRLAESEKVWHDPNFQLLPEEQTALFQQVNQTEQALPKHLLHQNIVKTAKEHSEFPALITEHTSMTYGELLEKAQKLAYLLKEQGMYPQETAAIVLEKSSEQIVAVLAILLLNGIYLPIDISQGENRRNMIFEKTGCRYVFTFEKYHFAFPENVHVIYLDKLDETQMPKLEEYQTGDLTDLAYIIYTSGSTGIPKGVAVSHGAAVNTIEDINSRFAVSEKDRMLQLAQLNFDLSVYDIFGLLSVGGALVFPSVEQYTNPAHWKTMIETYHVTMWNSVPALMQMLTALQDENNLLRLNAMRLVLLSGDWIPLPLPEQIQQMMPNTEIICMGGATEASVWSIYHQYQKLSKDWVSIPYGVPLANQGYRVLDEKLQDCPVWTSGELYITGVGLADGYYHEPELTKKHFFRHPVDGQMMYRTGDFGRYMPNGEIEFLGRIDSQVKVKGYRIELGEIETVLKKYPNISNAVVVVLKTGIENKLYAALESKNSEIVSETFMQYLKDSLAGYMIPSGFQVMEQLPLTKNGKIDRKTIFFMIEQQTADKIQENTESEEMTPLEQEISTMLCENLGCASVGKHQNLYEIGADSLIMAQTAGKIRNIYLPELSFDTIFAHLLNQPNVEGIVSLI